MDSGVFPRTATSNGRQCRCRRAWALLTDAGFTVAHRQLTLGRDLDAPVPPVATPAGVRLVPFDPRYDEDTLATHNEAFADGRR